MKYRLTILSFLLAIALQAQSPALVHLNQSFYVSGETVWYRLYLPAYFPEGDPVFTVALYGSGGKLVDRSYLRRKENGAVYGFYKIPYDWRSGLYQLVFSTAEEESNAPIVLADALVPIYDDLGGQNNAPAMATSSAPAPAVDLPKDLTVTITLDRQHYPPRGTARAAIRVTDREGRPVAASFSVSVRDELSRIDHPLFSTLHAGNGSGPWPELEDEVSLRGTLWTPDGATLLPSGNIGAYVPRLQTFFYDKGDARGNFVLDLPDVYGDTRLHVGGLLPEDLLVKLDREAPHTAADQPLPYPPEVIQYLELSRKRKTIYQLSGSLEQDLPVSWPEVEQKVIESDWGLPLDEYESFTDIPTFIKEMIVPLKFRQRRDEPYDARMFDPTQPTRSFHRDGPLFILDGQLTRDADFIANLDIAKIARIDLFYVQENKDRFFGPLGRHGVVLLQSRNRDLSVPEADQKNYFTFQGLQAEVDYPIQVDMQGDRPVLLRPALYWAPALETDARGEATVEIPLSDDRSRFEVEVAARDSAGRLGRREVVFVVGGRE